jgi:hypothetical protein
VKIIKKKFAEKEDFFSLISLAGSGFQIRIQIRILSGDLNPDPPESVYATLPVPRHITKNYRYHDPECSTGQYLPVPFTLPSSNCRDPSE